MKTSIKLSNEPVLDLYDLFTTPLRSETQQRHSHTIQFTFHGRDPLLSCFQVLLKGIIPK